MSSLTQIPSKAAEDLYSAIRSRIVEQQLRQQSNDCVQLAASVSEKETTLRIPITTKRPPDGALVNTFEDFLARAFVCPSAFRCYPLAKNNSDRIIAISGCLYAITKKLHINLTDEARNRCNMGMTTLSGHWEVVRPENPATLFGTSSRLSSRAWRRKLPELLPRHVV